MKCMNKRQEVGRMSKLLNLWTRAAGSPRQGFENFILLQDFYATYSELPFGEQDSLFEVVKVLLAIERELQEVNYGDES